MVVIMGGVILCAGLNLPLPFAAQFLSMLSLTIGFLVGGRLASASDEWRVRAR
ncbi:hypothetical protein D3C83_229070 [compost metagenome]